MDAIIITPAYAALFALLFFTLSVRTIIMRRRFGVALGHGDQTLVERAARAHANFAEYVPFALLLVFFLEARLESSIVIHGLCLLLLVGRLLHAYGVSQPKENYSFRVTGMSMTFTVLLLGALLILWKYAIAFAR
ncbi:MAG: MAPEG family protein [Pseudomonadota bacterium]